MREWASRRRSRDAQRKKHPPEENVAILHPLEAGETAEAFCRSVNISEVTQYRWKQQCRALGLSEVKELKALREEDARFRRFCRPSVDQPDASRNQCETGVGPS
jgi:hypothetical protein